MAFLNETGLAHLWTHIVSRLNNKVDKVTGKGLSTNDFTTADKDKLDSLTNITVDSSLSSTSTNPVQNKIINSALSGKAPTRHASTATTYGASSASNYGHAKASSTTPKANGTASAGSETSSFARGDHVHPLQTSVATATKATQDASGNVITTTYATKDELGSVSSDYNTFKTNVNTLLDSDDTTLDQMSEVVAYIKNNKGLIDGITTSKQNTITGAATTITSSNLTADKAVISNGSGKVAVSSVTSTELGYLSGVTSAIQTQLNNKVSAVSGKSLSTNDFTNAYKDKLDSIASSAEVNQNAFSKVIVGSTTIAADSKTDSLTFVAGSNVTITPDATNDKITIAATNTTYDAISDDVINEICSSTT